MDGKQIPEIDLCQKEKKVFFKKEKKRKKENQSKQIYAALLPVTES